MRKRNPCLWVAIVLVTSCGNPPASRPLLRLDPVIEENVLDFTKYADAGFLMTPESYQGDYESRGLIDATLFPEGQEKERVRADPNSTSSSGRAYDRDWGPAPQPRAKPRSGKVEKERWFDVDSVTVVEAMDLVHGKAVALGADALIHLKIENVTGSIGPYPYTGLKISGLAIRRNGSFN